MEEIGRAIPFYSGASHENLAREYGRQWPCTKDKPLGTRFLFEDGLPERRFKFEPVARSAVRLNPPEYPLSLVFGNSLYYWHHNILVQHSETLKREYRILLLDYPNGFVEINADDARQLNVRDGERIRLQASSGEGVTYARVTPEVRAGTVFVPYFVREVEKQILGTTGASGQPVPVRVLRYTT
jgi:formate dehydrogenase major subunit